ncbi:FlaD/FlaE family flagellar protein [Methanocaldococcus fervens]|uniref:Flagella protein n=1 Tax=Methanocaldococcus fervens (strain DSM 4213 / JCM 15782 / AG86) TaxID=573064 RepID=C7P8Y7_METFA|nr:FlaD/FlaE family flagellar protein [Methanocaldococcus fervens]ACV25019.1 flagella protein [Methanocaldococcus fervens AG86]
MDAMTSAILEIHKPAKLEDISDDDPIAIILALKWLEYLCERVGSENVPDVLEFYYMLGWLGDKALTKLLKYLKGIKVDEENLVDGSGKLNIADHIISLLFIERLNGKKISAELLDKIEWELRKIKKGAEQFYGI